MPTMTVNQAVQLALQHHAAGQLAEAETLYRQILATVPEHADALHLLGVLAGQVGQAGAGIALIRRAIAAVPDQASYHSNLGKLLNDVGQFDEAIACCRRALELKSDFAEAHYNLGVAWNGKGQFDEAVACYRRALALKPDYAEVHSNLGAALCLKGQCDDAIVCFRRALELKPDYAEAHSNLGLLLYRKGQCDDAIACFRRALELKPDYAEAHSNLGNAWKDMGQLDDAIACYRQAMAIKPDSIPVHDILLFTLQYHSTADSQAIFEEACRWNERHAEPLRHLLRPHHNDRSPHRRLKIGYVSPDFCDHVVARNLLPLFREHDHSDVEIFCYAQVARPDAMTDRLRSYAHHWRGIVGLSDQRVADLIRQDGVDILVDLTLHTVDNRLLVFARKPAPVQATFAGYPGTTGLKTIDYRLTDPYLDPPGLFDRYYSETSFRLPHTFWCFDSLDDPTPVNALPALDAGGITFGCLNNFCKVNEVVLRLWGRVLGAVQDSHLLLLSPEGSHRQWAVEILRSQGIAPERVEFVTSRPRRQYLELYQRIDIGLDTLPYNGHSTSLDSFWMGVPVITLVGQTVVGRAGLCQLMNLGLAELIARTPEQFVQIAADLANDLPRLKELRSTLRQRMECSPLMDGKAFARGVEAAYRTMWKNWCERARH